jgi:hypothetical protein
LEAQKQKARSLDILICEMIGGWTFCYLKFIFVCRPAVVWLSYVTTKISLFTYTPMGAADASCRPPGAGSSVSPTKHTTSVLRQRYEP